MRCVLSPVLFLRVDDALRAGLALELLFLSVLSIVRRVPLWGRGFFKVLLRVLVG